jgi:hypothetical protein
LFTREGYLLKWAAIWWTCCRQRITTATACVALLALLFAYGVAASSVAHAQPITAPNAVVQTELGQPTAHATNDAGQCNGPSHRAMHRPSDWVPILSSEGSSALSTAESIMAKHGYVSQDSPPSPWLSEHTIIIKITHSMEITDWWCPGDGSMAVWKTETVKPGTPMLFVLPDDVSRGDVSLKPHRGFREKNPLLDSLAQALCSNGSEGQTHEHIYVREEHKHKTTTVGVSLHKLVYDENGNSTSFLQNVFQFKVPNRSAPLVLTAATTSLGRFKLNSRVCVAELKPLSDNWTYPQQQVCIEKVTKSNHVITVKDREIPLPVPTAPNPSPTQPPAPTNTPAPSPTATPTVLPTPPPGTCNVVVIITGNGNNTDIHSCTVTIIIICSGVNVTFGGPDSKSVNDSLEQYEKSHNCSVVNPTPTPSPSPSPSPTPSPTPSPSPSPTPTPSPSPSPSPSPTPSPSPSPTPSPTPVPQPSVSVNAYCPPNGGSGSIVIVLHNGGEASTTFTVVVNGASTTYTVAAGQNKALPPIVRGTDMDVRVQITSPGMQPYDETFAKCGPVSTPTPTPSPTPSPSPSPTPTPSPSPTPTPSPSPSPSPSPTPTATPTPHTTQVTCTGFEEVSGNASFLVDCDVASDNNGPSSLKVKVNPSSDGQLHARYSGVNCYSNNGTASCPHNGTYEFRVTGINDTSSILYSSITVTATANGVSDVFDSGLFPVDPACGGFGCSPMADPLAPLLRV